MKKKLIVLLTVLSLCFALYACGSGDDGKEAAKEPTKSEQQEPNATTGEKNALGSAENYLEMGGFSKKGLREQLDYEGYSKEEIDYAIKNCDADWKEQCAKCAQNYMDTSNFSKDGLIEQLKFEGFTNKQIEYGVKAVGY